MIGDDVIVIGDDGGNDSVVTMTPYINGRGIKRLIIEVGNRTETITVLESEIATKKLCVKAIHRLMKSSGYLQSIDPYFNEVKK